MTDYYAIVHLAKPSGKSICGAKPRVWVYTRRYFMTFKGRRCKRCIRIIEAPTFKEIRA